MAAGNCVFCEIIQGRAPASIVYADERVIAFMDIHPMNTRHLLVVPKAHAFHLADLDAHTGSNKFRVGRELAGALRASGVPCQGVNLFFADGEAAGQRIDHVHLHVIPRFRGDGFGFCFGPDYDLFPQRDSLDRSATAIRSALDET